MRSKNITLKIAEHGVFSLPAGISGSALLEELKLPAYEVLALEVGGEVYDLGQRLTDPANVRLVKWGEAMGKKIFWQSTAHLLGAAVHALYPEARTGSGRATEQGFYYDVDFGELPFNGKHLAVIEKKMYELACSKLPYRKVMMSRAEALAHPEVKANEYKAGMVRLLQEDTICFCEIGGSLDIVQQPLLLHTGYVKAFKLLNIGGAYWQGDAAKKQLTRISGVSFPDKGSLKAHMVLLQEATKRDHRKLGAELGLFTFAEQAGLGLPLWLPKGAFVREELIKILRAKLQKAGYQFISTPHIGHKNLYVTSGHYEKYGENTFHPITTPQDDEVFLLKSMNCPHHCLVYQSKPRSYRDLPLRFAEFGTVYRYEQHGELHGLTRTRCFTQDDGHSFCMPEHIQEELITNIRLTTEVFRQVGFKNYTAQLSLRDPSRPGDYIGEAGDWEVAERALVQAIRHCGLTSCTLEGEAAFYGPKIDFMIHDALQRSWQLGTIQLDYQLPQRFVLTYTTSANTSAMPVMIHRAAVGSLERFIGILLEHTAGRLPLWLCPDQVAILPLAEKYTGYAEQVVARLEQHGIRTRLDRREEKISRKIRDAIADKIPYMVIIGEKEMNEETLTVRGPEQNLQKSMSMSAFVAELQLHLL